MLLYKNISYEDIAEVSGKSIEEIQKIEKSLDK